MPDDEILRVLKRERPFQVPTELLLGSLIAAFVGIAVSACGIQLACVGALLVVVVQTAVIFLCVGDRRVWLSVPVALTVCPISIWLLEYTDVPAVATQVDRMTVILDPDTPYIDTDETWFKLWFFAALGVSTLGMLVLWALMFARSSSRREIWLGCAWLGLSVTVLCGVLIVSALKLHPVFVGVVAVVALNAKLAVGLSLPWLLEDAFNLDLDGREIDVDELPKATHGGDT